MLARVRPLLCPELCPPAFNWARRRRAYASQDAQFSLPPRPCRRSRPIRAWGAAFVRSPAHPGRAEPLIARIAAMHDHGTSAGTASIAWAMSIEDRDAPLTLRRCREILALSQRNSASPWTHAARRMPDGVRCATRSSPVRVLSQVSTIGATALARNTRDHPERRRPHAAHGGARWAGSESPTTRSPSGSRCLERHSTSVTDSCMSSKQSHRWNRRSVHRRAPMTEWCARAQLTLSYEDMGTETEFGQLGMTRGSSD